MEVRDQVTQGNEATQQFDGLAENSAPENSEKTAEQAKGHKHPHTNAILAARLGHSAVNHVRPHHSSRLEN
mgnify:CR=1 FL=1